MARRIAVLLAVASILVLSCAAEQLASAQKYDKVRRVTQHGSLSKEKCKICGCWTARAACRTSTTTKSMTRNTRWVHVPLPHSRSCWDVVITLTKRNMHLCMQNKHSSYDKEYKPESHKEYKPDGYKVSKSRVCSAGIRGTYPCCVSIQPNACMSV